MFWFFVIPAAVSMVASLVSELSDDEDVKAIANDVKSVSNAAASIAMLAAIQNPMEAPKVPKNL